MVGVVRGQLGSQHGPDDEQDDDREADDGGRVAQQAADGSALRAHLARQGRVGDGRRRGGDGDGHTLLSVAMRGSKNA